jgi:hypothetical protein
MLMRYFTDKGAAPPGVLSPTYVYAMDGDTKEATPKSVRPINTAIPYVIAKKLAPSHFNHNFTQKEPAVVARDMLDNRGGEVLLIVWLVREGEGERGGGRCRPCALAHALPFPHSTGTRWACSTTWACR